ncbi:MAG: mechanosensitive ion channel [Ignavibacteria bacterium]|nr:mechanosensitive ion channel [Ignavibacteria bacterium]
MSVGIGFGLQNIVNNVVSGLFILLERPVKLGDRAVVDGMEGDIVGGPPRATGVRPMGGFCYRPQLPFYLFIGDQSLPRR